MANLSAIRAGIVTRLRTIEGLRAYAQVPGTIDPPVAVVQPMGIDFDLTMADGSDEYMVAIVVAVSQAETRTAQLLLDDYLAKTGDRSIRAAIDADQTLGGVVDITRVAQMR